ncbi:MAG: YesL family protein [Oscillospiraceae bacterium]|nr:YesL family protein [Oscillospiraceae bacterium]
MYFQKKDLLPGPDRGLDAPEKTGTARFWELIKEDLPMVLIVNVLFIVTCIPIVTIPPALFSLHMVVRKIITGEGSVRVGDYFTAFKQGWKRAYGAFFLAAVPMGLAGYGAVFYLRRMSDYPMLLVPFAFCTAVFLVAALSSTYLYGLLDSGRPLRDTVKSALLLGVAKPLRAVLAALCCYGLPLLAVLYFPLSGAYLFLLGFSLPCLLGHFYIRTVLKQYRGE